MGRGGTMNQIRNILALIFGGLLSISCATKSEIADADSSSAILMVSKVELTADPNGSFVLVKTNKEPKYNVFKLMDPERVVIDLIDAKIDGDVPTSIMGEGFVEEIKIQALEDSLSSLVRLEVILKNSANYLAELSSEGLSVRLLKVGEIVPEENKQEPSTSLPPLAAEVPPEQAASSEPPAVMTPPELVPPSPEIAAAPVPLPVPAPVEPPAVAEVPKVEEPIKIEEPLKAEMPPKASEVAEAPKTEEPELLPLPVPVPVDEKPKSKGKSKKDEPFKAVGSQDIGGSLTDGTSLLTELDNKVYTGRRVSLEFQDADVQDILRLISEVSKLNIIAADDVKGKLTLKLIDVPWDQALDIILATLGLDKTQHGNIIRVAPSEKLRREREVALANDKAAKQLEPLKLKLINVNYAKADEIAGRLKNLLSDRGTVDTDGRTNTLIVKDIREHLTRMENLVKALDTQTPQVRIESRIVQANDQFSRDLGIAWGPTLHLDDTNNKTRDFQFPHKITAGNADGSTVSLSSYAVDALPGAALPGTLGFRLGSVSDIFSLDLKLQYLEQESLGRVVSRPSISVLDNKTARIIQGTKIPYLSSSVNGTTVSFQEVGVEISVTPQITADGSVILKVSTRSNEPLSSSVGGNPITTIREANTEMLVKSGRTAVLGGVFKSSETSSKAGVPGLYKMPLLGWLFGNNKTNSSREETLVFITPYILNDQRVASTAPSSEASIEK